MATLNLSCPCGATFAYTGTESYLVSRSREWQKNHLGHTAPAPVAVSFDDVAELRASLEDKLRDAGRELAAEIKADLNRQTAAEWAAYDGIQGHQLGGSVEAYLEGLRARAEAWRTPRLGDPVDPVTPDVGEGLDQAIVVRNLRGYVDALRDCAAAYTRAGFEDDASDVADLADDLAALLAGRPLDEIVRGFYGQPGVPDPTGPSDRPVGYGVRRHHPIEENPARVGPPTTVGPGTSGHLEVLMGPGETIRISVDPARSDDPHAGDVFYARLVTDNVDLGPHLRIDNGYVIDRVEVV